MKRIIHRCLAVMLLSMPAWAWAQQCTTSIVGNQPIPMTISGFTPPSFDPTVANGTVLHSAIIPLAGSPGTLNCPGGIGTMIYRGTTGTQGLYSAYQTSIPGIGLRFSFSGSTTNGFWPQSGSYGTTATATISATAKLKVEMLKIGPITQAGMLEGEVAGFFAKGGTFQAVSIMLSGGLPVKPLIPTCVAEQPAPISLGNIPASRFSGVGSTSDEAPFSIALTCTGGTQSAVTTAFMTLTDQTTPANRSNTLSLTSGSTARGIGIRIKHGSNIISYGPDSSAAGTENQWKALSSITNGSHVIPLTGSYIQVEDKVTGGSAHGRATFTMSYQ